MNCDENTAEGIWVKETGTGKKGKLVKVLLVLSGSSLTTRAGYYLTESQNQGLYHAKISNQSN